MFKKAKQEPEEVFKPIEAQPELDANAGLETLPEAQPEPGETEDPTKLAGDNKVSVPALRAKDKLAATAKAEELLAWLKLQPSTPENKTLRAAAQDVVDCLKHIK